MKKIFVIIASVIALFQGLVSPISAAEESYQFTPGANLYAYPIDPGSAYSAADLLTDLNQQAEVSSIQHYNTQKGLFETCVWKNNVAAGADFPIQAEEGYIVHTSENFTFTVSGDRICPQVTLASGLNTASFPCVESVYDAHQLLQDLGSSAIAVKTQNPADSSILTATRENDEIAGDYFTIEHGHSYLVYMDSEVSWYPTTAPLAPENATGYAGDQLAILTWPPPAGNIIGYNIYRADSSGGDYEKLNMDLLQVTEYTDSGLVNGTPWYYVVSAVDEYGRESSLSSEVTVTPANTGPTTITADITVNTTWTLSGSPYAISDSITVLPGTTLTLEPGVIVEFHTGRFDIDGKLLAKGTAEHQIVFRADDDSWTGLRFDGTDTIGSILEYCHIEDASRPVAVENYSDIEISYCSINSTSSDGLYFSKSNGHIHHTSVSGSYSTMRGIYLSASSPLIEYNNISSRGTGIYMYGDSSPQILHNSITEFSANGLDLSGATLAQPYPTVTGNTIETNRGGSSTYLLRAVNYYNNPASGVHRTVNVKNNYWGTDDPGVITASISQWTGGSNAHPYVDFSDFLDRPDGNIVQGHFISSGPLPAEELSWSPEQGPYIILGHALVDSGDELIIAPGTEVQFAGGGDVYSYGRNRFSSLQVLGKLMAVGTAELPIHLFSESDTPEKSDWYGIVFLDGHDSTSVVSYCRIQHAYRGIVCFGGSTTISQNEIIAGDSSGATSAAGVHLENANTSSVTDNIVSDYSNYYSSGIYIRGSSSPTVTGNTFEGNRNGVYCRANSTLPGFSTAQISSNTILNNTEHSVYLYGSNNDATNPQPVFFNNTILAPTVAFSSFDTTGYGSDTMVTINAQNNWWGTYDAAAIAIAVYDKNDNSSSPWVDYRFFLDDTGTPGIGNQVLGDLAADTSITWSVANSPYIVIGSLNIPSGSTLTIDAGVEIWMSSGETINVDGKLIANGTESSPVLFSAGSMIGTPSEWEGIRLIGSGNNDSILTYCHISNAKTALYMEDCNPTISHCDIASGVSSYYTVRLLRSSGVIEYSTIRNLAASNYSTSGLYIEDSSPQVTYNTISDMHKAIMVLRGGTPQILHNTLTDFTYTGINLDGYYGDPFPTITNNTIKTSTGDSNTWFIRTSSYGNDPVNGIYQVIDATNNYWGTTDPQLISGNIDQWDGTAGNTDPIVDFSNFLDPLNGSPVSGHFIAPGHITESTWDSAQGPCIVLGHSFIANGETLTISPGTEVKFLGGNESIFGTSRSVRSSLHIYGKLAASGTSESIIHFYSNHYSPTQGDWSGIFFYENSDEGSVISYSKIEHAYNSVDCTGAAPEISNNKFIGGTGSATNTYGIRLDAGSDASVSNNSIREFDWGIYIRNCNPTINGNHIEQNNYGVEIVASSTSTITPATPTFDANAVVDNLSRNIYVHGSGDDAISPRPVFYNNSFISRNNAANSFYTYYYSSLSTVTINAENNWWGTSDTAVIDDIIYDQTDYSRNPVVDYEPFMTTSPVPLLYRLTLSSGWISPNSDGIQDTTTVTWQGSPDISNWTITIKNEAGGTVRTYSAGSLLEWVWDGKDNSATLVADGQYTVIVSGSNGNGTIEQETIVNIDTTPLATVQIHFPTEAQVLQNIFDTIVSVQCTNISSYKLEIGKGSAPTSWKQLNTATSPIENVSFSTIESNTTDTDTIPSLLTVGDLTNGAYVLRLTATDLAGNTSTVDRSITLNNVFITDVSITELYADPFLAQSASANFTLSSSADVEFRIYTETDGDPDQLVRTINQSVTAGTHSFSWDGKNDSAENVAVGAYTFTLAATTGTGRTDQFTPDRTLNGIIASTQTTPFNPFSNDWYTVSISMGNVPGRYLVKITPSGEDYFTLYTEYAEANETFLYSWDGRRPDGTLVDVSTAIFLTDTWSNENLFIVRSSSAPRLVGQAPAVNVKSDPSLVNFCYGEQTSILYSLDRQAEVSITLFPLGQDGSSPDAIILLDQEIQSAGDHTVTWTGSDISDLRHVLLSQEGLYNFVIEATAAGITSTNRGVVSLFK